MRIASTIGAETVNHQGQEYTIGDDGYFDVPQHVGEALIGFPHWATEAADVDARNSQAEADARDPEVLGGRVEQLEQDLAALRKDHDELLALVLDGGGKPSGPGKSNSRR